MSGEIGVARGGAIRRSKSPGERELRLDLADGTLFCDGVRARLRPKTLGVLVALLEHEGSVVNQDALRRRVWGARAGNDAGPKQCIRELRRLLGDTPAAPRCIETVGRSGYRLLVPIEVTGGAVTPARPAAICVGRAAELATLAARGEAALRGERTIVLVAGEPGAGKTRLTDAYAATLAEDSGLWIARGQSVPHVQARAPYGPLLDVLAALAEGRHRPLVHKLLAESAPSWLAQMPGPVGRQASFHALGDLAAAPPDRMLREFCTLMERLTRQVAGVLILEDLHWADPSSLGWLAAWGLRRSSARLLVVGTYRSDEVDDTADLGTTIRVLSRAPGVAALHLDGLDAPAVADYFAVRFPGHRLPADLAFLLAERTGGNPLLIDAVVEGWSGRDVRLVDGVWTLDRPFAVVADGIATSLRGLIAGEIDTLAPDDRRLLEAASVVGARFPAAALATGRAELEAVERRLEALARRRRFIESAGITRWPDDTVAATYAFRHALHHEALYDLIPAANRQGLHRRIGERLLDAFGRDADDIAPTLANHFERGGDGTRAAAWRARSGATVLARGAAREAVRQFRQALALGRFDRGGDTALELDILQGLGAALIVSEGFTASDLPAVYRRAHELSRTLADPDRAIPALAGLWNYHVSRGDIPAAAKLAGDLLRLAPGAPAALRLAAHNATGMTRFFMGDIPACLEEIAAAEAIADDGDAAAATALLGEDPNVVHHHYAACVYQLRGETGKAERQFRLGLDLAVARRQPFGMAQVFWSGAVIAREQSDPARVLARARLLTETCRDAEIAFWQPAGDILAGWARVALGESAGLDQLRAGVAAYETIGVRSTRPFNLALLAEALMLSGHLGAARRALADAMRSAWMTGEQWYAAELARLSAHLSLIADRPHAAARALWRARTAAEGGGLTLFAQRAAKLANEWQLSDDAPIRGE
jgi:DNA-binding winged helix-turn-helix (wHTH) protein